MKSVLLVVGLLAFFALAGFGWCLYEGVIWFNNPSAEEFPVRGVDVSHHQGDVNWAVIAKQNISFAFIKATEGGDFVDPRFADNWREARQSGMKVGAYHFFRAEKDGKTQARNFIAAVPSDSGNLPPVLDVECPAPDDAAARQAIRESIAECLALLEAHYGQKPIIYATPESYLAFIRGAFDDHPLWMRSIFTRPDMGPDLEPGRGWLFWQYSSRGRLSGYTGEERFIDLNVFAGSAEDLAGLAKP